MNPRWSVEARGYLVWVLAGAVFAVPEIWASADSDLPFPTLSGTVGHLERRWEVVSLVVIVVIANALLHGVRIGAAILSRCDQEDEADGTATFHLSGRRHVAITQGRVTLTSAPTVLSTWVMYGVVTLSAVALGFVIPLWVHGWTASDAEKQLAGEFGYGAMGIMFFAIPTLLSWRGVLVPFPSLFQTVLNLERRVPPFAVAVAGCMTFLMLHLVLYPYPSIIPWFQNLEHLHNYCVQQAGQLICHATKPK